jgi:hypothetical protein
VADVLENHHVFYSAKGNLKKWSNFSIHQKLKCVGKFGDFTIYVSEIVILAVEDCDFSLS